MHIEIDAQWFISKAQWCRIILLYNYNHRAAVSGYLTTISVFFAIYDVTSWHIDSKLYHWAHTINPTIWIVLNNSKILHDIAWFSTGYKNLCTCCSLTVAQVAVVSYQTILQYWCRKNKNATGKGVDYKCFGPRSMFEGLLEGNVACWNLLLMWD